MLDLSIVIVNYNTPKMDLRQSPRWAIPGWLFILFLALFHLIQYAGAKDGLTWATILKPLAENGLSPLQLVLAVLAAGLPLGYLMDQLYWFHYWNRWDVIPVPARREIRLLKRSYRVPWIRFTSFVPYDLGYEILKDACIDFQSLVGVELDNISEGRQIWPRKDFPVFGLGFFLDKPRDIIERYKRNWSLAEFAWYHTLSVRGLEFLDERAQFLGNSYHSLGAARTALQYAFVAFALLLPIEKGLGLDLFGWSEYLTDCRIRLFWNLVFLGVMYLVLSHAREDALRSLIQLEHHVVTALAKLPRTCAHDRVDMVD